MNVVLHDKDGNYYINNCFMHKYQNVSSYKHTLCQSELTITLSSEQEEEKEEEKEEKEMYYIFDCPGEDALIHWIAECFIFYPLLLKLKTMYPNIKILTKNTKKYVKNIFRFFEPLRICETENNIESISTTSSRSFIYELNENVCNIDNNIIVHEIVNKNNNICFFSPIISLNDLSYHKDLFTTYLKLYIDNINLLLCNNFLPSNKVLLLPRNSKDNYIPNDRIIQGIEDLEKNIITIGGIVLNTYQINNIALQLSIIKCSETIIVDFGSAFFFNCLFVKNKKIIILNNYNFFDQVDNFISMNILYNFINKNNEIIDIKSFIV